MINAGSRFADDRRDDHSLGRERVRTREIRSREIRARSSEQKDRPGKYESENFRAAQEQEEEKIRDDPSLAMWLEKIFGGVLRVLTPLGPRYIKPALSQRIYLLWIFRHFHILPVQVLSARQRRF